MILKKGAYEARKEKKARRLVRKDSPCESRKKRKGGAGGGGMMQPTF